MIPAVPIDLVLNVAFGSSVALASRRSLGDQQLLRTPALWSLLSLQVFLFVPVGIYLLFMHPAWSMMYLHDANALPVPDTALAAGYPLAALVGFLVARKLIVKSKLLPAVMIFLGSMLLSGAIVWFGREQLLVLGTTQAFRSGPETMRATLGSELSFIVAGAGVAITLSWVVTLWRLVLLGRVVRPHRDSNKSTVIREEDQAKLAVAGNKKSGRTKKAGKKKSG